MKRIQRDRNLTPAEVARDREAREKIANELPEIVDRQRQNGASGHMTVDDLLEVRRVVVSLCDERRRQGISLSEISQKAGLEQSILEDLESHRMSAPGVAVLTRYARALGKRLDFRLSEQECTDNGPTVEPSDDLDACQSPDVAETFGRPLRGLDL